MYKSLRRAGSLLRARLTRFAIIKPGRLKGSQRRRRDDKFRAHPANSSVLLGGGDGPWRTEEMRELPAQVSHTPHCVASKAGSDHQAMRAKAHFFMIFVDRRLFYSFGVT